MSVRLHIAVLTRSDNSACSIKVRVSLYGSALSSRPERCPVRMRVASTVTVWPPSSVSVTIVPLCAARSNGDTTTQPPARPTGHPVRSDGGMSSGSRSTQCDRPIVAISVTCLAHVAHLSAIGLLSVGTIRAVAARSGTGSSPPRSRATVSGMLIGSATLSRVPRLMIGSCITWRYSAHHDGSPCGASLAARAMSTAGAAASAIVSTTGSTSATGGAGGVAVLILTGQPSGRAGRARRRRRR